MRVLAIILLSFLWISLIGQYVDTRIFTAEDGVPHLETTGNFIFDGNLYAQSGENILRFNGYGMDIIPKEEIPISGYCGIAYKLKEGVLWHCGVLGGNNLNLIYFDGSEWSIAKNPIWANDLLFIGTAAKNFMIKNKDGMLYIFNESQRAFVKANSSPMPLFIPPSDSIVKSTINIDSTAHYYVTIDEFNGQNHYVQFTSEPDTVFHIVDVLKRKDGKIGYPIRVFNNHIIYLNDKNLISKISKQKEDFFDLAPYYKEGEPSRISWTDISQGAYGPWIIQATIQSDSRQLYYFEIDSLMAFHFLGKEKVPQPFYEILDPQKNIWRGSHQGLMRINPFITLFDYREQNMVDALHTIVEDDNGTIWFGGYSDGFAQYKNFSLSKYSSNQELPARILPGAAKLPNGDILFLAEDLPRYWIKKNNGSWRKLNLIVNKKRETRRAGYYVGQLNDGRIAIGMQTVGLGIVESIDDKEIIVNAIGKEKGVHLGNVLHFTQDSKDRVWMGRSTKGVAIYDMTLDTAITFKRIDTISNTFGAMSLAYDKSGTLWMGTNRGLAYISNASSFDPFTQNIFNHAQFITLPDGDQSLVTSVKIIDEYLVFGNNTSINFLDLHHFHENPNSAWIYQLRYGEDVSGNGTEQNCILEDSEGFLWVGTQEGALKIDIKKLPIDTTKPKISIVNISTGRGDLEIVKNQVQLPVDSRNLDITFGPDHNPSLMKNTFFDYMMTSSEGDTLAFRQYDRDGSLSLNYIPPENYSLNIIAKKHGQIIDKKSISISAPMSLSENPITWASLAIIIGGIGIGFITIRNRQKRRIAESELKLAKLESERKSLQVQSIISSFNPHFINNSLHWAQTKYRKDEEFTQLIDGLSSNIGYIFGMARQGKSWHKLKDEILLVNNYVEIQKVRFNNSFKFVLPNQDRLLRFQDFPVLLMQLQIHVENAIEHGLANRNKGSLVKIEIEEQERFLIFKITDDGCGRKKAKELGSSGTQMGTKMLKELYKIYNSENKIEHQLKTIYEDDIFEDEEGVKYGTRVIIELPKSFKYEN